MSVLECVLADSMFLMNSMISLAGLAWAKRRALETDAL